MNVGYARVSTEDQNLSLYRRNRVDLLLFQWIAFYATCTATFPRISPDSR